MIVFVLLLGLFSFQEEPITKQEAFHKAILNNLREFNQSLTGQKFDKIERFKKLFRQYF
jgi:hypothetical protein